MSQPTIKDVAKLAGVSISTVSRVMNKSKPVSPEAERKVVDAINKLGFKPNELARSLVMKKSNSIGILVKDIGIEYMAQMIRGVEEIGKMYNYDILLSSTYGDFNAEKKAVDFLYRKQVEGIIILAENIEAEIIVKIREYHLPYLLLDRFYKSNDYRTVTVDYRAAMSNITDFLIRLGHKDILYIKARSNYDISENKRVGYEEAMRAQSYRARVIEAKGAQSGDGYAILSEYEDAIHSGKISAILAETDAMAIGILNYCYDHNIRVPEDVSVAGFGNSDIGSLFRPRLTTVLEPYYDIGAVAMRLLTKILQNNEPMTETVYLPTEVVARESTAQK